MPGEACEPISRSNALQRAMQWLMATQGQAIRDALENEFFGSFDPEDYEQLKDRCRDSFDGIMVNATEWLLADGFFFAKEITSVIIPHHWLKLFANPFEIPQLFDHMHRELLLLVTDHYRVQDWKALGQALSGEADVESNSEKGWSRFFEGENGLPLRKGVTIEPGKCSDRLKVFYCTIRYANVGRFWFERIARHAAIFVGREVYES